MSYFQKYEAERIQRIKTRQEDCRKIEEMATVLLAQEAKYQGLEGTECIEKMSKKNIAKTSIELLKTVKKMHRSVTHPIDS